ncbi:MAG: O-antigen ligase family protein [Cytophagales bacterium]|nr:O-antigen ligase family protein [Cytophagales bacterium]
MSYIAFMRFSLSFFLVYFVFQSVFQKIENIRAVLSFFVLCMFVCALYALKQEYFGLSASEVDWLNSSDKLKGLMITWGKIRKFSFMASPVALGLSLALAIIVLLVKILKEKKGVGYKLYYAVQAVVMLIAMGHTSTRTAYVLIPVGVIFYFLLDFSYKNTLILLFMGIFALGAVAYGVSSGNRTLYIVSSAFNSNDPSLQLRFENQRILKSIIAAKPIGSGLGSCGAIAHKYTPMTFLANFPPDSEFVRAVIDVGWIGLIVYFYFLFNVLRVGIVEYFKCRNDEYKMYFSIIITLFFMLVLACYPQEIFGARPIPFVFALLYTAVSQFKYLNRKTEEELAAIEKNV